MVPVHMLRLPLGVQLIISASAEYQTHVLLPRANDTRRTHLVVLALIWSEVCWERMSCFEPLVSAPSLKISAVAASHSLQETAHGADVRRVRPSRVLPGPQPTLVMLAANDVFEPLLNAPSLKPFAIAALHFLQGTAQTIVLPQIRAASASIACAGNLIFSLRL